MKLPCPIIPQKVKVSKNSTNYMYLFLVKNAFSTSFQILKLCLKRVWLFILINLNISLPTLFCGMFG